MQSAFPPGMVIYQIYPRSFQDTNGDGIGDLPGITSRLDYLHDLGVTAIWMSPFFTSPQADNGYDVSDYLNVDPAYGTLKDFDKLIAEAHKRGIQVVIDLVLNHTSQEHPWFTESRSSLDNPKRDWYVWRDGKQGERPPNNWLSIFGGSAWQLDETTGQYYLHTFFKEQPDLNWENPEVRRALRNVARFWLERGVDGFRLDAVYWFAKDPLFRNDPINEDYHPHREPLYESLHHVYSKGRPKLYMYMKELADVLMPYKNRYMISEAYPDDALQPDGYMDFYQRINPAVEAPFNFQSFEVEWKAKEFKDFIDRYQKALRPQDTPVYVLGNHDRPRVASRLGEHTTRAVAMLQATLPGTTVIYYGDEIGMKDVDIPAKYRRDQLDQTVPDYDQGRDPERTPMQWSGDKNAGFTTGTPWLPIGADFKTVNVNKQLNDTGSLLNLYRQLLALRKESEVLQKGSYEALEFKNRNLYGFLRSYGDDNLAIVINFSASEQAKLSLPGIVEVSTHGNSHIGTLLPGEGKIIRI